jgi:hypothetical protein
VLFDKLAKENNLGDGYLCPRCRTFLIPVHHLEWPPPEGAAAVPRSSPAPAEGATAAEPEKPTEEGASSEMSASSVTGPPPPEPSSLEGPGPGG